MLALLASYILIAYLVLPGVIFRGVFSLCLFPLKKFQRTKTEEMTFAVLGAIMPFFAALVLAWILGWPWATTGTSQQRRAEYRALFEVAISDKPVTTSPHPLAYWTVINQVERRQQRLLFWYYPLVAVEAWALAALTQRYWKWLAILEPGKDSELPSAGFVQRQVVKPVFWLVKGVLRAASEWDVLLTTFTFDPRENRYVHADALVREDKLFRGTVDDYHLDAEGRLSGIFLKEPSLFRRQAFLDDRHAASAEGRGAVDPLIYWKQFNDGSNIYIPADKILDLNITYPPHKMIETTNELLKNADIPVEIVDVLPPLTDEAKFVVVAEQHQPSRPAPEINSNAEGEPRGTGGALPNKGPQTDRDDN